MIIVLYFVYRWFNVYFIYLNFYFTSIKFSRFKPNVGYVLLMWSAVQIHFLNSFRLLLCFIIESVSMRIL